MIKILQQQLEGFRKITNLTFILNMLNTHAPDVLLLSGLCYACEHNLMTQLQQQGYKKLLFPATFDKNDVYNHRITCGTLAAVKQEITFNQHKRDSIKTQYRYIEGTLQKGDTSIELFFGHAPNTLLPVPKSFDRKKSMINGVTDFMIEHQTEAFFIGGNYATALDGSTSLENLFGMMYSSPAIIDTDTSYAPTWRNKKRMDYALVSSQLRNRCKTSRISNPALDHVGLLTEIA